MKRVRSWWTQARGCLIRFHTAEATGRNRTPWLVLGSKRPVQHMALGTLSRRLLQDGIGARTTRNTALLALGADLPAPGAPRQPVGAVGPGRQPPLPHRHLRCPHREGSRGAVAARPTRRRAIFDGVFLLRPQLNDAWDLRIFPLRSTSRRRSDVPRWTPGHQFWVSGFRCYAPARLSAPFPMGLVPARIHRKFIAILSPPWPSGSAPTSRRAYGQGG
jgi:hypothetical protein